MIIKILLEIFIAFAIFRVVQRASVGDIKKTDAFFWILFWIAGGTVVLFPELTVKTANLFGVGRGVDFVFYLLFAAVFYVIFRISVRLEKTDRSITKIVRSVALKEQDKNK